MWVSTRSASFLALMRRTQPLALALFASLLSAPALAGPGGLPTPAMGSDFSPLPAKQTTSAYFEEGGWLVYTIPVAGDVLYACPPLAHPSPECRSVVLPVRSVGSVLESWFIDPSTGAAWFKISAPPLGDFLLACFEPQSAPHCTLVEIEDRPPLATLTRLEAEGDETNAGGLDSIPPPGGISGSRLIASGTPGRSEGSGASSNPPRFWMTAALPTPGPVTLYACSGLDEKPACSVAVAGLQFLEAEDFGFQKLSRVRLPSGRTGVVVGGVAAGSVAEEEGIREGDVVTAAAGFELLFPAHLKGLLAQVAVGESIRLEVEGTRLVKLTRRPRR